jgi:hypothetical protein
MTAYLLEACDTRFRNPELRFRSSLEDILEGAVMYDFRLR